ncbi:TetR/AcrR family transcriptional regulator [Pseudonocardia pini]|uniref:TetR/AcrR family transcriptional regulator n=1 Tax=Pseudonocardia pini TaxID=2758030 RepID=UPI0015F05E40|nr:TetR family transcriptional regulator [Pseudonocardia pini]
MRNRRDTLLDAAVRVLGGGGVRALTHRAVDAEAGLPVGSTANHFSTREALLEAIVERVSAQERANFDEIALTACPTTPSELAHVLATAATDAASVHRDLTLARYAILVESAHNPTIRQRVAETGNRVGAWFTAWMRLIGSHDPDHLHLVGDYVTGLVLHQLAMPDPAFDPAGKITRLLESLVGPGTTGTRPS